MEIITEAIFNVPVSQVWKAITDKAAMQIWYFQLNDFKPEKGFEFTFTGEGKNGTQYLHICEITEVIPFRKLSYTWRYENLPGLSAVSFNLEEREGKTYLELKHSGVETFTVNGEDFQPDNFREGWRYIVHTSLKNYLGE